LRYQEIKGEKVPSLGLGTWRLSGEECDKVVERALALGYRHIDTAQMYANEGEVGRGIRNSGVDRGEVFLVTKVRTSSFSHDDVLSSTRESLKKLQTEYVDLLLMHWPNSSVPLEETLGAMRELQGEGSVKHVGVSNFPPSMVEEAASEVFDLIRAKVAHRCSSRFRVVPPHVRRADAGGTCFGSPKLVACPDAEDSGEDQRRHEARGGENAHRRLRPGHVHNARDTGDEADPAEEHQKSLRREIVRPIASTV
jgi:hypothetical protein